MKFRNLMVTAALVSLAACGGEESSERVELGDQSRESARANWSDEFTASVDSANAAYAEGDYETAQSLYSELTEERPELGVVWFGLYMAENALGNEDAARQAMAKVEELSPGLGRMHDAATDSTARVPMMMEGHPPIMPQGHPPTDSVDPGDAPALPMQSGGV